MTNYNDGQWHGWNGGECPMHPKTRVHGVEPGVSGWFADAEDVHWQSFRGAFRVVKEHREPREWWLHLDEFGCLLGFSKSEPTGTFSHAEFAHVREVVEHEGIKT